MASFKQRTNDRERTVIDEELIRQAILEDRASERESNAQVGSTSTTTHSSAANNNGNNNNNGGNNNALGGEDDDTRIDFATVDTLILSFKNILRIENLQGFDKLTKLQLDNNHIEKIEHLDHLVNLTWLDLSFNHITKIENLEKLTQLTDVSLFHNQIAKIENLEKLTKLNVLSLGCNQITSLDDLHHLRQFPRLRSLTMRDNPIVKDENYLYTTLALLKHLKYLDYELINPALVKAAREEKHEELQEMEERERQQEQEQEREAQLHKKFALASEANLVGVETLFDDMMKDDPELPKLRILPGFSEILQSYRDQFDEITRDFVTKMLDKFNAKKEERRLFNNALQRVKASHEQASIARIELFAKDKKIRFMAYDRQVTMLQGVAASSSANGAAGSPDPTPLEDLRNQLLDLSDALMDIEMQQVDQISRLLDDLYEAAKSLQSECCAFINNYTGRLLELEKIYHESVSRLTQHLQEKHAAGQLLPALEETAALVGGASVQDLKTLFDDKELLNQAVSGSHEKHEEHINNLEGRIGDRERGFADKLMTAVRDAEYQRNRQRVSEIFNLVERNRADINDKLGLSQRLSDQ